MTGRFDGRVAVVTGGARGIGRATARRFVAEGARVILADVVDDEGEALATELGCQAIYAHTDVADESAVANAIRLALDSFGALDIMFNNAGIIGGPQSIRDIDLATFRETIDVDLVGVFLGLKHAARVMTLQRRGVILSTASPAGIVGGLGPHPYSAAKAAVVGLTLSAAAELRPFGVRVNAIVPGATVTSMTAGLRLGDPMALEEAERLMQRTSLLGRPGRPEDIAAAAAYLASDDAALVTGSVLTVDAGLIGAPSSALYAQHDTVISKLPDVIAGVGTP